MLSKGRTSTERPRTFGKDWDCKPFHHSGDGGSVGGGDENATLFENSVGGRFPFVDEIFEAIDSFGSDHRMAEKLEMAMCLNRGLGFLYEQDSQTERKKFTWAEYIQRSASSDWPLPIFDFLGLELCGENSSSVLDWVFISPFILLIHLSYKPHLGTPHHVVHLVSLRNG